MGNTCVNFKRKKRLQQEELDFRRRMEERIQQSSKRLKKSMSPAEQIGPAANDLSRGALRKRKNNLDKPTVTPLRLNAEGIFVEVDQQFIDEQLHRNYLRELDRQHLINNRSLASQLPNQPNNFYQQLSRLNQLRILQSTGSPAAKLASLTAFDNGSFVNTSIDSGLYDRHILSDLSVQNGQLLFGDQLDLRNPFGRHGQLHPSLSSINYNREVMNATRSAQFNSNLILNSTDLNQRDYQSGSQLGQLPACTNVLDVAANRIFSELEYMDNGYLNDRYGELNPTSNWCGYLPLDGFMQLNKSKSFNLTANRSSSNAALNPPTKAGLSVKPEQQPDANFNPHQRVGTSDAHNLNKTDSFNSSAYPKSQYSVCLEALDSPNNLKRRSSSSNDSGHQASSSSGQSLSHNSSFNSALRGDEPTTSNSINNLSSNLSGKEEANDCRPIKEEDDEETRNYLTINSTKALMIEEQRKNELNDSGNSSGTGCTDKPLSGVESTENQINSQITAEPWFFPHINSRTAAEHVLRMKGNRVGAFLVRHAQKAKFSADSPFVLSLKVIELSAENKPLPPPLDKSWPSFNGHHLQTSNSSSTSSSSDHPKTKDILHYKIYSQSACSNCNLFKFYVNPGTRFGTIRQLIAFYSENENHGLPIRLEKPCLPFDAQNCCCSANGSLSSGNANSARVNSNCDICNELMLSTKNRRSAGNLPNTHHNQPTNTQPNYSQSILNSSDSTETFFSTYIEHNPNAFVKLAKDELKTSAPAQLLSKSLNSVRASSVDRISNNGIPVNSSNRILTDIRFNSHLNHSFKHAAGNRNRFSSLDDVGSANAGNPLNNSLVSRLSLKDRFRNRSVTSINYSDGAHPNLTSSGSSLSRKSSDSRKSAGVRSCSLIGGQKYRLTTSSSFKENVYTSADNLKRRRSSSIRLKPGSSGKYQLRKVNSCIVNNGSSLKNSNP